MQARVAGDSIVRSRSCTSEPRRDIRIPLTSKPGPQSVVGRERRARFVGLDPKGELVRAAFSLLEGATLRERDDWPRHFCPSAVLAALKNPLVGDVGGLLRVNSNAPYRRQNSMCPEPGGTEPQLLPPCIST